MTITHIVLWKLGGEISEQRDADFEGIRQKLEALNGVVPSLRSLKVRRNLAYPDGNHDVALFSEFDDVAGLEAYQVHPAHVEAAGYVRERVHSRAAADFTL
ncbi:Dabb family protein [Arenivirga flava]|uniref:Stress-response A/B barrel domain-containing protein n=1 Tax=Arenivirga flava TaxID=1930060 RepID=A0AA37UGR4_9MICO|nr:Dabb family protein [Arenivirga flava]GMA29185.1 hypothetical protein GCM10025874_24380 [Arenivirga flava]